jgi:hypothetical protein
MEAGELSFAKFRTRAIRQTAPGVSRAEALFKLAQEATARAGIQITQGTVSHFESA